MLKLSNSCASNLGLTKALFKSNCISQNFLTDIFSYSAYLQ